ncbi:hypothetical protein [Rhizobium rhizogenes]|uniref:hypothetical protein n=1 Tax=Rhizobium rhizogenes TaxID=359 RepID=UPI0015732D4B|nr:hypothetical protein [Rhizobium rhizogenes]NTF72820.1 hypothetical protein [Rhizobium rhizogenes]
MTRSDKSQSSWGTYCRSYLVTLGALLGGGSSVFLIAHYTEALSLPWQIALLLSTFLMSGILLALAGLFGTAAQMERLADATSDYELVERIAVVAHPVYLMLRPIYERR